MTNPVAQTQEEKRSVLNVRLNDFLPAPDSTWQVVVSYSEKKFLDKDNRVRRYQKFMDSDRTSLIEDKQYNDQGLMQGPYYMFDKDGHHFLTYQDGLYEGEQRVYADDGQLIKKFGAKQNCYDGAYETYYSNGQKASTLTYAAGVKIGKEQAWDQNGRLIREIDRNNSGQLNGHSREWVVGILRSDETYESGVLKQKMDYVDNRYKRVVKYNDDGTTSVENFHENGQLKERYKTVRYKNENVKNGSYESFHWNGMSYVTCNYKNDMLVGNHHIKNQNGILTFEAERNDEGKFIGVSRTYNDDGTLKKEGTYGEPGVLKQSIEHNGEERNITIYNGKSYVRETFQKDILVSRYKYDENTNERFDQKFNADGTLHQMKYHNKKGAEEYTLTNNEDGSQEIEWHKTKSTFFINKDGILLKSKKKDPSSGVSVIHTYKDNKADTTQYMVANKNKSVNYFKALKKTAISYSDKWWNLKRWGQAAAELSRNEKYVMPPEVTQVAQKYKSYTKEMS
jgi:antitoxin component YwqK of YwqJK toxin-antitoxin module